MVFFTHKLKITKPLSIIFLLFFMSSCATVDKFTANLLGKNINISIILTKNANSDSSFLLDIVPLFDENDSIVNETNEVWFNDNHLNPSVKETGESKVQRYSIELSPAKEQKYYIIKIPAQVKKIAVFVSYRENLKNFPIILEPYCGVQAYFKRHEFLISQNIENRAL